MSDKSAVRTEHAPAPFKGAPYSQAIRAGGFLFVSGQLPLDADSHALVGDAIGEQTEQVFRNIAAILESAGSSLDRMSALIGDRRLPTSTRCQPGYHLGGHRRPGRQRG